MLSICHLAAVQNTLDANPGTTKCHLKTMQRTLFQCERNNGGLGFCKMEIYYLYTYFFLLASPFPPGEVGLGEYLFLHTCVYKFKTV